MTGQTRRGASSARRIDGAEGGDVMVVRGCDWPRHTVSKSCQIVLHKGDSDQMDFRISSRTAGKAQITSVQSGPFNDLIWFGPLSYAVLNQIQEGSLSMRPQVEQSSCNSCEFDVIRHKGHI